MKRLIRQKNCFAVGASAVTRLVRSAAACILLAATSGCSTVGGGSSVHPSRMFSVAEVTAAVAAARAQGMQEGLEIGRRELEPATRAAFSNGLARGRQETLRRIEDESCARDALARQKLSEAATNFLIRASVSSLLNGLALRSDKAATMQAWQVLDLVTARLAEVGYKTRLLVPADKVALVRQYEQARVYLSVSDRFRGRFVENFEKMNLLDGLGVLYRLYGFTVWIGEVEPVVWLGYFNAGPEPVPNMALELRFDEDRIGSMSSTR